MFMVKNDFYEVVISVKQKSIVFVEANRAELIEEEIQNPGPGEVLVKLERSTISSGTERANLTGEVNVSIKRNARRTITELITAMEGRPVYVTNYTKNNVCEYLQSDEELAEEMLMTLECGASLLDIRGDMFGRNEVEITTDNRAVGAQKALISEIHKRGGQVLMSSHVLKYCTPDETLQIALLHQQRGADVAKIVTLANSEEELNDNFETLTLLNKKLEIPSLFLCNGTHCKRHRILGPALGSCMF